ncbi:hypothetical protein ACFLQ7_00590 [Actinomycetota bacterium]
MTESNGLFDEGFASWALSGLTDPASGSLHREAGKGSGWHLPGDVQLEYIADGYGVITWSHFGAGAHPFGGKPDSGFLEGFIELEGADDDDIASFARRWGVMMICRHGLPATHAPDPWPLYQDPSGFFQKDSESRLSGVSVGCRPIRLSEYRFAEPIEIWRRYARRFRALLDIAALLHRGDRPPAEYWEPLGRPPHDSPDTDDLLWPKAELAQHIDNMLLLGNVRLGFEWIGDARPQVSHGTTAMFSELALQLCLAAARSDGTARCSSCARAYLPTRRPNPNRRNYCPTCRKSKIPERDASRARRARAAKETNK